MGILNTMVDKAKALKSEFDQRRRTEWEEGLGAREEAVRARDQALQEKDQALRALEASLEERERLVVAREKRPKQVFWACNLVWGAALVALVVNFDLVRRVPAAPPAPAAASVAEAAVVPAGGQSNGSCQERGVRYYQSIGSYPTLTAAPNQGRRADELIAEMCARAPSTAFNF